MQFGIPTILFAIFTTLKLTNHIDWSWVWVTSPLWLDLLLVIPLVLVFAIITSRA